MLNELKARQAYLTNRCNGKMSEDSALMAIWDMAEATEDFLRSRITWDDACQVFNKVEVALGFQKIYNEAVVDYADM